MGNINFRDGRCVYLYVCQKERGQQSFNKEKSFIFSKVSLKNVNLPVDFFMHTNMHPLLI